MTPEQQKDSDRLERYIVREGLSSVMNDTKWRELINVLEDVIGHTIRFRIKTVLEAEPRSSTWNSGFPEHVPRPFKAIEWFEINPVAKIHSDALLTIETQDFSENVINALQARNIPFVHEHGTFRIHGYIRVTATGG